jgi:hypothetical protein
MGRIFDDAGNRMTPTSSQKGAMRYRFYLSAPWKGKSEITRASVNRVSASDLETTVAAAVREKRPANTEAMSDGELVKANVRKITVSRDHVSIHFLSEDADEAETIELSRRLAKRKPRRDIIASRTESNDPSIGLRSERHRTLLTAIAKGRRWASELIAGHVKDVATLAQREQCSERYVRFVLPLASLAPEIVAAAIANHLPPHITVSRIRSNMPISWKAQCGMFPH